MIKNTLFLLFMGSLLLISCNDNTENNIQYKETQSLNARKAHASLTENEQALFAKLQRMGGEEFRHELNTYSKEELEKFTISFLKNEVIAVLAENGTPIEVTVKQLNVNPTEPINKAINLTVSKLNF